MNFPIDASNKLALLESDSYAQARMFALEKTKSVLLHLDLQKDEVVLAGFQEIISRLGEQSSLNTFASHFAAEHRDKLLKAINRCAKGLNTAPFTLPQASLTNTERYYQFDLAGLESGSSIMGCISDVTTVFHKELIAEEKAQQYQAIFNQTFQFMGLLDREGRLLEASENSLAFGGLLLEDIQHEYFWKAPWWSSDPKIQSDVRESVQRSASGKHVRYETEMAGIGGTLLKVELSIRPVLNASGQVIYLIPEAKDISDKREIHDQLIALNQELERKVQLRTEELKESNDDLNAFTSSVSHDLRTPLRAMRGFAEMLEEDHGDSLNEGGANLLAKILDNTERMDSLIDDLLLFARTSKSSVQKTKVDMHELFHRVKDDFNGQYPTSEIKINLLSTVQADANLIYQVASNLMGNALKYSSKKDKPTVVVSYSVSRSMHVFSVMDNGVGFDPAQNNALFKTFSRLGSSKGFEGSGVGLSIVKRIVEKHGGNVWAESQLNQGAEFFFSIPMNS